MRKIALCLALAGVVAWGTTVAWGWFRIEPNEVPGEPVRLVAGQDVPDGLGESVKAYLEKHARVGVVLASAEMDGSDPLDVAGQKAAEAAGGKAGAVATIVLAKSEDKRQVSCRPEEGFGVLNVPRLGGESLAEEIVSRRAGQESLRILAILAEQAPCPFPLCVLTGYSDPAELDEMSENYCPPCFERIRKALMEKGAHLLAIEERAGGAEGAEAAEGAE